MLIGVTVSFLRLIPFGFGARQRYEVEKLNGFVYVYT